MRESAESSPIHPAPAECLYCDHTDPNCGFCEMGKPLDTQEDWDNTWGRAFDVMDQLARDLRPKNAEGPFR